MREFLYQDLESEFISLFRVRSILPIIGSGFTVNCHTSKGIVPSGRIMKKDMIDALVNHGVAEEDELKNCPYSKISAYYE